MKSRINAYGRLADGSRRASSTLTRKVVLNHNFDRAGKRGIELILHPGILNGLLICDRMVDSAGNTAPETVLYGTGKDRKPISQNPIAGVVETKGEISATIPKLLPIPFNQAAVKFIRHSDVSQGGTTGAIGDLSLAQAQQEEEVMAAALTGEVGTTNDVASWKQSPDSKINSWRVTNQQLKIMSLNTVDDDGSWFEACRVTPSYDETDTMLYWFKEKPTPNEPQYTRPTTGHQLSMRRSICDQPSYVTGKLYDLQKYLWALSRKKIVREFNEIPMFFGLDDTDPKGLVDEALDSIYIRIHGTSDTMVVDPTTNPPTTAKNNRTPTRLLITLSQTIEVVHDANSIFKLFSSIAPKYNNSIYGSGSGYAGRRTMRQMKLINNNRTYSKKRSMLKSQLARI